MLISIIPGQSENSQIWKGMNHMDQVKGSMEALSAMQVTADMEGLDAQSKTVLHSKEVLAVILQGTVSEYKGYSRKEIMDFIETDSITETKEVSPGRTNTQVRGDSAEFIHLNEKASNFDLAFRAKNPVLSSQDVLVSLHIDLEPQKDYSPGYPIEKRGLYYLARYLSSQLSLVTDETDYGQLEKCYGIWLCRDHVPQKERYSISIYEVANTKNIGIDTTEKASYDLMTMVVVRLGEPEYHGKEGDEGYDLLRFLSLLMYPHKADFMGAMKEYIDFSDNEELWKEVKNMGGLGQSILEEGLERGLEQGIGLGIERERENTERERENTERERQRADAAEARVRELEQMLKRLESR